MERLTALWALNEAGMGGLIHAAKIPFTGIVVGSVAVILVSAIGFFAERKATAIFRATMVVLLIKLAVSPHTPAPAYLSVTFQGLAGALLFGFLPWPRVSAFLLGLLALWQGALQKLIVMTLIYGRPLWESVDAVGEGLIERIGWSPGTLSPTAWFLILYMSYCTVGGLLTGWLAATLPGEIDQALREPRSDRPAGSPPHLETNVRGSRKPWWRRAPFKAGVAAVVLCAALVWLAPASDGLVRGLRLLVRAALAIGVWLLLVRPLAQQLLRWFQRREQGRYGTEVARAMSQLPSLRGLAAEAWTHSQRMRGFKRWKSFFVEWVARALTEEGISETIDAARERSTRP